MGLDRNDRAADTPDDGMGGIEDQVREEFDWGADAEGSDEPSGWSEAEITTDEDVERDSWTRKKLRELRRSIG
jgi:hypothetical protein